MPIVHRYIIHEVLKAFSLMLAMVIGIYLAVDFFEKIDDFMEVGLPFSRALTFFLFKTPFIMAQVLPICILLAVLVVFGLMNRHNEMIALQASGVSTYSLMKPLAALGAFFFLVLVLLSEAVVPAATEKANRIWLGEVRKENVVISREKNIWIKSNRRIIHIKLFHPPSRTALGLTVNDFDKDFHLTRRIDAEKAVFTDNRWQLQHFMEQARQSDGRYTSAYFDQGYVDLNIAPKDLTRVMKKSDEMGFRELLAYIRKVEAEGYAATSFRVDLWAKIAFPFVCIIFCLIGTGIAAKTSLKDGMPVSIAYGMGIAFLYWIFYSFCLSLGYGEMLPPAVAAWSANLVFLCLAVFTLIQVE